MLLAVAGRLKAARRLAKQARQRNIGRARDNVHERQHRIGDTGPRHLDLLPLVFRVDQHRAVGRFRLIGPRHAGLDVVLALLRPDDAHQVLELEHVDGRAVDQACEAALREVRVVHRLADRLHDRVAPEPRLARVETTFRHPLADERHDARRMELYLRAVAAVDGEEVRLAEPRIGRVEPLLPFGDLPARHDVDVLEPALGDAGRVERLRRVRIARAEDERRSAEQAGQHQRAFALGLELEALLLLLDRLDVDAFGLPVAPLARHVERRDVDDLAHEPRRTVAGFGLLAGQRRECVEGGGSTIDRRSHARHDVGQSVPQLKNGAHATE
jgi:hypothetical protein